MAGKRKARTPDQRARALGYSDDNERRRIRALYKRHDIPWEAGSRKPSAGNIARVKAGKKPRNYRAEEQRRNARAEEYGFSNRNQQRVTQRKEGVRTFDAMADECALVSANGLYRGETIIWLPRSPIGEYNPNNRKKGVTIDAYTKAYYYAFISGPQRWYENRYKGSRALRHFFYDICGYTTRTGLREGEELRY